MVSAVVHVHKCCRK